MKILLLGDNYLKDLIVKYCTALNDIEIIVPQKDFDLTNQQHILKIIDEVKCGMVLNINNFFSYNQSDRILEIFNASTKQILFYSRLNGVKCLNIESNINNKHSARLTTWGQNNLTLVMPLILDLNSSNDDYVNQFIKRLFYSKTPEIVHFLTIKAFMNIVQFLYKSNFDNLNQSQIFNMIDGIKFNKSQLVDKIKKEIPEIKELLNQEKFNNNIEEIVELSFESSKTKIKNNDLLLDNIFKNWLDYHKNIVKGNYLWK